MRLRIMGLMCWVLLASMLLPPAPVSLLPAQQPKSSDKKSDAPVVTLPATLATKPGRLFYLIPKTNCASVKWIIPASLDQDTEIVLKNPLAIALSGEAGTYTVGCYGAIADQASDIAQCIVTIGTPPPPPPPPPLPPPDSLTQALQTAYTSDTDPTKASLIKTLQTLYTTAAASTVADTSLNTLADLLKVMQSASASLISATALTNTRAAIAAYLVAQLGTDGTVVLSADERTKAKTAFSNIAGALGNVK